MCICQIDSFHFVSLTIPNLKDKHPNKKKTIQIHNSIKEKPKFEKFHLQPGNKIQILFNKYHNNIIIPFRRRKNRTKSL